MSSNSLRPIPFSPLLSPAISKDMNSLPRPPASIVAAGIVAILAGAFVAFSMIALLLLFSRIPVPANGSPMPPELRPFVYLAFLFFLFCGVLVVIAGIYLIRLREWARVALLIVAGCALFFGLVGIGVIFFTLFIMPPEPGVSKPVLAVVLAFTYGLPVAVALWWLILLTRRAAVDQFRAASALKSQTVKPGAAASRFNNPLCPLAIRIIAWYLSSFLLFIPLLPFLPKSIPALYFGQVYHGPKAMLLYFLSFSLFAIPGFGLLLLQRWSYPVAIASQLFVIFNLAVTVLSPSFESTVLSSVGEMGLPSSLPASTEALLHHMRYINLLGIMIPLAIIAVLLMYRRPFLSAADSG